MRILVDHDALVLPILKELDELEARSGDTSPATTVGAVGRGMEAAAIRIRRALINGSRAAGPAGAKLEGLDIIQALLPHVVEWVEERDHGATYVYCVSCRAHGEAWGRTPYTPPVREHRPGCALRLALDAAQNALRPPGAQQKETE